MDWGDYLQYMLALVFVLALIGLIAIGVKRFGIAGTIGGRRTARIAVLEAAPVDKRRRLLLIRRDNVEHLVMIGGSQDFVVESGIEHDPSKKLDVGSSLRPLEPPLTSREPVLHATQEPKRTRRTAHPREDLSPAEPKLEMPREPAIDDPALRSEDARANEPDRSRMNSRQPEQPTAEAPVTEMPATDVSVPPAPATHIEGASGIADSGNQARQPERAPRRAAPPSPTPVSRETSGSQDNHIPCDPARIEPQLYSRPPTAAAEANAVSPKPQARTATQPQGQRRPAEVQQDRAPAPKHVRQPHPQAQAPAQKQTSQRTRPQPPAAQPAAGQRIDPTNQAAPRQPSRQPQTAAGSDPDLLILNDPVARPRRA